MKSVKELKAAKAICDRRYRSKHKEKIKLYCKNEYQKHKAERQQQSVAYYHKHRKQIRLRARLLYPKNRVKLNYQTMLSRVKCVYGMDKQEYTRLLAVQKGLCMLCNRPSLNNRRLDIDHNHVTGVVRGLICNKCNLALGLVNENIPTLKKMVRYLNADSKRAKVDQSLPNSSHNVVTDKGIY